MKLWAPGWKQAALKLVRHSTSHQNSPAIGPLINRIYQVFWGELLGSWPYLQYRFYQWMANFHLFSDSFHLFFHKYVLGVFILDWSLMAWRVCGSGFLALNFFLSIYNCFVSKYIDNI